MKEPAGNLFRVSTAKQDEANQFPDVAAWNESHRYDVARSWTLHGKSAFKRNKQFDKMWAEVLAAFRDGIIRVLVVWKSDRFDRKLHMLRMVEEVVNLGGRVEFVTEAHLNDLSTMAGRISLKIAEEMAYEESRIKSERITADHAKRRAKSSVTTKPAWGYRVVKAGDIKTQEPTEICREYAPRIFARINKNESLAEIALWLMAEKVAPAAVCRIHAERCTVHRQPVAADAESCERSGRWSPESVGQIVRCKTYMGRAANGAGAVLRCEAVIDAATWQRANDNLNARPGKGKGGAATADANGTRAMLAAVLWCPACDGPMYRVGMGGYSPVKVTNLLTGRREQRFNVARGRGGDWKKSDVAQTQHYYRCAGKNPVRRSKCKNMVPEAAADNLVTRFMATLQEKIMRTEYIPGHDHQAELAEIEMDMAGLRRSDPDYKTRYAELDAEYERVAGLKKVLPETRQVDTKETYASRWAALSPSERGDWLRSSGIRIYAIRADDAAQDGLRRLGEGAVARADAIEGDGVRVVVAWNLEALRAA